VADQQTPAPAAPSTPPPSREEAFSAAFAEALKEEGLANGSGKPATEAVAEPPKVASEKAGEVPEAPANPPKEEEPPSDPLKRSFEKLAKEKEALRKEADTIKPYMEMLKAIPPHSLQALARAAQSGDPMALLAAAGYSYADVAKRVVTGESTPPAPQKTEERPAGALPPEVQGEIAELRAYVQRQQQQELMQRVKAAVPPSLKHINGLEAHDLIVRYVNDFAARTGSPPGETFEESVAIAAEAVEAHLAREAQRWAKVLTPGQSPGTVPSEALRTPPQQPGQSVPVPKTPTNAAAAPASAKPEPTTRDERLKALLNDPEFINSL
jgi:hypothetical protein